jgi:hypothetical protein
MRAEKTLVALRNKSYNATCSTKKEKEKEKKKNSCSFVLF